MLRKKYALLTFVALVALVALFGCRTILGIEGDGSTSVSSEMDGGVDDASEEAATTGDGGADATHGDDAATDTAPPCTRADDCPIEVLADDLSQGTTVAVDDTNIYFAVEGGSEEGGVYQCPKTGCVGKPILLGTGYARGIASDGTRVYWNDFAGNKIVACAIGGCANAPTTIASSPSPRRLAFDGINLFWFSGVSLFTCPAAACGTPKLLSSDIGNSSALTAESGAAYFLSSAGGGGLYSCEVTGCTPPTFIGPGDGTSVGVRSGFKAWIADDALVFCAGASCSNPNTIGASSRPNALGLDQNHVYWLDDLERRMFRCPRTGCGTDTKLISHDLGISTGNITLDGEYVYWVTVGRVLRRRK